MTWIYRHHHCNQPQVADDRDLWRCDDCGTVWEALGYGDRQAKAWRHAGWWTRRRHHIQHEGAPLTDADAEELKRRFLEAQETKPEPWEVISEPRDTGDRWGIWPLVIGLAIIACAATAAIQWLAQ